MKDYERVIDGIIKRGIENHSDTKRIVDEILGEMTEVRKSETISITEFEKLIQEVRENIRQTKKLLMRGLTG